MQSGMHIPHKNNTGCDNKDWKEHGVKRIRDFTVYEINHGC